MGIPRENIFVVENGSVIEFKNGKVRIGERIPGGYIFVEGSSISEADPDVLREREQLAQAGVFFINLNIDKIRTVL